MKLHQSLIVTIILPILLLASGRAFGAETDLPLVEVELHQDNLAPYKERREDHGIYAGVIYEPLVFKSFVSAIDDANYSTMFGAEAIPLVSLLIDYKYNFMLGSLSAGISYGQGKLSDSVSGVYRTLEISKTALGFKYSMDMLMTEPYVVPYVGLQFYNMSISDSTPTQSFSETLEQEISYSLGVLLQLDWIDYETAKHATFYWGLENTFIDLFITKYTKSADAGKANMETDPTFGAGIRLEF